MIESVISVRGLGKRYRLGSREVVADSLAESVWQTLKSPFTNYSRLKKLTRFDTDDDTVFWALRDVEFDVRPGEVLGIIGHNGAGKSTLLKILSRITEPSVGEALLFGRVSSLLEVGTGFHPDLTGRENVYMNGTILGMTRKEIDSKFDEILDFSGVEKYIDTAVKYYSSGMKVRLGFAVAAHLEPEILIIDEVLSVGDIGFQRKCLGKIKDTATSGRTVLFVSHDLAAVKNLCSRIILLNGGSIEKEGAPAEVISYYVNSYFDSNALDLRSRQSKRGNGDIELEDFFISDAGGARIKQIQYGQHVRFNFRLRLKDELPNNLVDLGFSIHNEEHAMLTMIYSSYTGMEFKDVSHHTILTFEIRNFPLTEGRYFVNYRITNKGEPTEFFTEPVIPIEVTQGDFYNTGVDYWKFTKDKPVFLITGNWKRTE